MPSAPVGTRPTRGAVFEPLIALAKARTVALVQAGALDRADGEFLLRALFDLESDGIGLFGGARPADEAFYTAVADYLVARVGSLAHEAHVLAPESAEAAAVLAAAEGRDVAELLVLPGAGPCGPKLDRAVIELVSHQGGKA